MQAYGSKRLDASLLLIPLVGFLPASDPRVQGTLQAIEEKLLINREFVLRYETENVADGLPAGEGAFLACSFWLVDNYILQARYAEARKLFDRLLSRFNDVGLLSEEFDPVTGRLLGNFPQAYSHVGLINCALGLSRQTRRKSAPNHRYNWSTLCQTGIGRVLPHQLNHRRRLYPRSRRPATRIGISAWNHC